jgi:two-component system cell cycle sensor histidine kinase/response regulator CckA
VYLVERRGRQEQLSPTRQVEIGTLLESMPDAIVIINADYRIVDLNQAAARILGGTREQFRDRDLSEAGSKLMNEDSGGNVLRFRRNLLNRALGGEQVHEERRVIRDLKTGRDIQLVISANPICDPSGKPVGALVIARDITELIQLQSRFSDMERHLAIGQVAASIAHDFNNTLETISHAVVLLQASPEPVVEERHTLLRLIQSAVEHGTEIIARIRDYARSGTGELSEVNVRELLEDALEWTDHLRHRRNRVQLARELKQVPMVRANAADLRRVFTNLIINALQAMPEGGKLTVGSESDGERVHVWIKDTGAGVAKEDQRKLFLPYFTTKHGGTGLGLSGAQKIMLALGGDIRFQSEAGKGTQFDLYLPVEGEKLKSA